MLLWPVEFAQRALTPLAVLYAPVWLEKSDRKPLAAPGNSRDGLRMPEGGALTPKALRDYRETYVAAMRVYNAGEGNRMRSWNLPFLIRHSAFHAMDHAWEMEDKDLTAAAG